MDIADKLHIERDMRSDSIESHLSAMDSPTHPWYLSTKAMFRIVNKATLHLPANHTKFEQSLNGIIELTKFINDKTARGALYINLEKTQTLIDKLDAVRSDQFAVLNDGHDHHRTELSTALRNLEASIAEQKCLAAEFLSVTAQKSQQSELQIGLPVVSALAALNPASIIPLYGDSLVRSVQQSGLLNYFRNLYHTLDTSASAASTALLLRAQPYVHAAYQRGNPLVASAAAWSQPYIERVAPLVAPLRQRVQQNNAVLRQNPLVGAYVNGVYERAELALQAVTEYCAAPIPVSVPAPVSVSVPVPALAVKDAAPLVVVEDVDSPQELQYMEELAL